MSHGQVTRLCRFSSLDADRYRSASTESSIFFCWHMFLSHVVRRRQPGSTQRWLSASVARRQHDFSTRGATVQEGTESQPESETRSRDAREDPPYEEWLDTIGRQYKRTDRRNWLGGSVVRLCFPVYSFLVINAGRCSRFR